MKAEHFEILVEEPSMEAFLRQILPNLLGAEATFEIYPHQGKDELLARLADRLRGYAAWLPSDWRIIVIVDRDDDDCLLLKQKLEASCLAAGLSTPGSVGPDWQVCSRIAIEELEAWYFGDWDAVRAAYGRLSESVPRKAAYRDCDRIAGGTWEAFQREVQKAGYFIGGLRKIEAARSIGTHFTPNRCTSGSFRQLLSIVEGALISDHPDERTGSFSAVSDG